MPITVDVAGVGAVDFPEGMTDEEIKSALDKEYSKPSALRSLVGGTVRGIGPTAAFVAAAPTGAGIGAGLGPVGAVVGGLVTGGLAAYGASKVQQEAADILAPESILGSKQTAAQEEAHPYMTDLGGLASGGFSMKFAPGAVFRNPLRAAIPAGVGATLGIVQPLIEGGKITIPGVLQSAAFPLLYGQPRFGRPLLPRATREAATTLAQPPPATEETPDASGIRAHEGQVQEGGAVPEGGPGEGGPNLEQPAPGQPGGGAPRQAPEAQAGQAGLLLSPPGQGQIAQMKVGDTFIDGGREHLGPWKVTSLTMDSTGKYPSLGEAVNGKTGQTMEISGLSNVRRILGKRTAAPALTPEEQAYIDAEREGMGLTEPVELAGDIPEGNPFAGEIAAADKKTGRILINPANFKTWLSRIPEPRRAQAVRSLLSEESIHLKVDDAAAADYWGNLTAAEKAISTRRYMGRKGSFEDQGVGIWHQQLSDTMAGHEALRFRLQQLSRMTPREIAEAVGQEKWKLQGLTAVESVIRGVRETLGTKASQEQLATLGRIASNIGIAQTALGAQPGARLKQFERELIEERLKEARKYAGLASGESMAAQDPAQRADYARVAQYWQQQIDELEPKLGGGGEQEAFPGAHLKGEEEKPLVARLSTSPGRLNAFGHPMGTTYHGSPEDFAQWQDLATKDLMAPGVWPARETLKNKYGGMPPEPPQAPGARLKGRKETSAQETMFLPPPPKAETLERGGFPVPNAKQIDATSNAYLDELPSRETRFTQAQAKVKTLRDAVTAAKKVPGATDAPPELKAELAKAEKVAGTIPKPFYFEDFRARLEGQFGAMNPDSIYYAWTDALQKRLVDAPGAQVQAIAKSLGLPPAFSDRAVADRAAPLPAVQQAAPVPGITRPHFTLPERGLVGPYDVPFKPRRGLKELSKAQFSKSQQHRAAVLSEIIGKLSEKAGPRPEKPWSRPTIGPEDVGQKGVATEVSTAEAVAREDATWGTETERQFRSLTPQEASDPRLLGDMATRGAAIEATGKGAPPRTVTRNLVVLRDNLTGKLIMVSAWRDPRTGPKVTDPAAGGTEGRPINNRLVQQYTPRAIIGLREPVKNFRQVFNNQQEFDTYFGDLAIPGTPGIRTSSFVGPQAGAANAQAGIRGAGAPPPAEAGLPPSLTEQPFVSPTARELTAPGPRRPIPAGTPFYRIPRAEIPPGLIPPERAAALGATAAEQTQTRPAPQFTAIPTTPNVLPGAPKRPLGGGPMRGKPARMPFEPGALLKFKDIQEVGEDIGFAVRGTADALKNGIAKKPLTWLISATADKADNDAHNNSRAVGNGVRAQSAGPNYKLRQGNPQVLGAAKVLIATQGIDETGGWHPAAISAITALRSSVNKGIIAARAMENSPNWRDRRIGKAWSRSQQDRVKELDYAQAHWNDRELIDTAKAARLALKEIRDQEIANGFDVGKEPGYIPQRWDASLWNGNQVFFGRARIQGTKYRQARTFPDYYTASGEGPYIPVTGDLATLTEHRVYQGLSKINAEQWRAGLTAIPSPDGRPVAITPKMVPRGAGMAWNMPPSGYSLVNTGYGALHVHDDFAPLIRALTSPSKIQDTPLLRNALYVTQVLKHSLLMGDFFHMGRVLYYGASIMGRKAGFRAGLSALDYRDQDLDLAVRRGLVRPSDAAWARGNVDWDGAPMSRQEVLRQFTGANIGKMQDALYKDLITNLSPVAGKIRRGVQGVVDPSLGRYQRFLFDKLTRGMMAESLVNSYETMHAKNPRIPSQALADDIGRDVNNFFGNIGRQGLLKSRTWQDTARIFMLAPQWVEGLVRKEMSFMGRVTGVSKGLDELGMGLRDGMPLLGTTGAAVGRGLLFMFGFTQALNLIWRHQFTWQNPEKEHKFDAFIPSFGGNKEGFWLSPMALWNEIAHDLYRFSMSKPTFADAVDQIAANKESPIFRALAIMATGRTGMGEITTTTGGRITEAAKAATPMPLTFGRYAQWAGHQAAPGVIPPNQPGALERQTYGTFGLKVEPQSTATSEVGRLARDWMKQEGVSKESGWQQVQTDEPSYTKLRRALQMEDERGAARMFKSLTTNRSEADVIKAMTQWAKKGFTTKEHEAAFRDSLSAGQDRMYEAAMDSKADLLDKFHDFLNRQP